MKYEKQLILTNDRNPDGGEDYEASHLFMVGEVMALEWNEDEGQYGDEDHYLRPAWSTDPLFADDKGRCWHHSWCWNPAEGYTATGYGSELMPFEDGVKVLVEHDVFSFPLPPLRVAEIQAIRVYKPHKGHDVEVHVELAGEDCYRKIFEETVLDGICISHVVLPSGVESGPQLDF